MLYLQVGEMVTCEPEWEPALAHMSMTGERQEHGEIQEQPMLTVQPNLYFGTAAGDGAACGGGGAFEVVVQESKCTLM